MFLTIIFPFYLASTQVWALIFPFPQFLMGGASVILMGPLSVGAWYFYVRVQSFIVAGQVHKRHPFSKLIGPWMHIPFYGLVPYAIWWLWTESPTQYHHQEVEGDVVLPLHYWFVAYTTCITAVSCLLDAVVFIKYLQGQGVGSYKQADQGYEQVV